jgi:ribosomal protein S18 acetylase RimI-like enzyme
MPGTSHFQNAHKTRSRKVRLFGGEADLSAMQELLTSAPNPFESFPGPADLPELLAATASGAPPNALLWEDEDSQLTGFALVSRYRNLHFHFRPDELTKDVEDAMVNWAVHHVKTQFRESTAGPPVTLDAAARDDDRAKVTLLLRHGFTTTGVETLHMRRCLNKPLPEPSIADGFTIRPLAGKDEVPDYVAVHRAAYGTDQMTIDERLAIMEASYYLPALDLVVVGPEGHLAGFCLCTIDAVQNARTGQEEGEVAILGTRPEYRNLGLARSVTLAGLRALKERRAETAILGVSSANTAAIRLYEGLGFRVRFRTRWYARDVEY